MSRITIIDTQVEDKIVKLISPKFKQTEIFSTGLNLKYLILGLLGSLFEKRYFEFFYVLLLSFLTLGLYWIIFAFTVNKIIIRRKVNLGYKPLALEDYQIIESLKIKGVHPPDSIKLSRLNSVDGNY